MKVPSSRDKIDFLLVSFASIVLRSFLPWRKRYSFPVLIDETGKYLENIDYSVRFISHKILLKKTILNSYNAEERLSNAIEPWRQLSDFITEGDSYHAEFTQNRFYRLNKSQIDTFFTALKVLPLDWFTLLYENILCWFCYVMKIVCWPESFRLQLL